MKEVSAVKVEGAVFFDEDRVRDFVRRAMASKGESQRSLCLALGMSRANLYEWLSGKSSITYKTLWKMLVYLREM